MSTSSHKREGAVPASACKCLPVQPFCSTYTTLSCICIKPTRNKCGLLQVLTPNAADGNPHHSSAQVSTWWWNAYVVPCNYERLPHECMEQVRPNVVEAAWWQLSLQQWRWAPCSHLLWHPATVAWSLRPHVLCNASDPRSDWVWNYYRFAGSAVSDVWHELVVCIRWQTRTCHEQQHRLIWHPLCMTEPAHSRTWQT